MGKTRYTVLLLAAALTLPLPAAAGVFMCTDPVTGKKTFTDKACPSAGQGKKVKVQPTNFGSGTKSKADPDASWSSDRDTSVAGRDNFRGYADSVERARIVASTDETH